MAKKLNAGDTFPELTVNIRGGGTFDVRDNLEARYNIILLYRGHWGPYWRRQLAGYEAQKEALAATGAKVILSGSVDGEDKYPELGVDMSYPLAVDMTREQGEAVGAWWDESRKIIQPSEFIIRQDGSVASSTYSSGPIGRVEPEDAVKLITLYASRE